MGNYLLYENRGELTAETLHGILARLARLSVKRLYVAVVHHHDHGLCLAFGNEVVHDVAHLALVGPAGFVFAHAVLQVEHRVSLIGVLVILGRSVHEAAAPLVAYLGVVPALVHESVRHILQRVIVDALFGNLDTAHPLTHSEEGLAVGVGCAYAVDYHLIVVKSHNFGLL